MTLSTKNGEQMSGLKLVPKPVRRVEYQEGLREGSTGRVVFGGGAAAVPSTTLHRVWAVADGGLTVVELAPSAEAPVAAKLPAPKVELAFYRKYTEALLRRYLRLSMQAGRVPSLLGRELFRGNVTSYRVRGFEEVVIFCHDVESRLSKLSMNEKELIKRIAMQQYSRGETAAMLGMNASTCRRDYDAAVDHLTRMLLESGLLDPQKG
jgi:hypothetical protein